MSVRVVPVARVDDLTHEQPDPPLARLRIKNKVLTDKGRVVQRDPAEITGICIHQTACRYGASPAATKAAGGDEALARHRRALGAAYHVLAFVDGVAVHSAPLPWYMHHGNGFNATTIGLAIEGKYGGEDTDIVPAAAIAAARCALEYIVEKGRAAGMPLQYIFAHRQSSPARRADPGADIWQRVVVDYAIPALGLKPVPRLVLSTKKGDGRPIPKSWDPEGTGPF